MQNEIAHLALLGSLAAGANLLGGFLLFSFKNTRNERFFKFAVAAGAGYLLAIVFIEMLPRTIDLWTRGAVSDQHSRQIFVPMALLLGGYLLINFFEQILIPHLHLEPRSTKVLSSVTASTAVGGLLFHAFFDGVALASARSLDFAAGLLVFAGVFLHKLPEGFTAASLVTAAGGSRRRALAASAVVGLTTLLGVAAFAALKSQTEQTVAYALPVAAGVTLYVAASELIPELYHHGERNRTISIFVFAGVCLFFALDQTLHALIEN